MEGADEFENMRNTELEQNGARSSEQDLLDCMRYEYYIHYIGIDRRNDRWVTE